MTNKASDSTSGAGMETVAWSYVPSDAWVDVVLTDDQEKALRAAEFGRPVTDLVRRTDASRLLAEKDAEIARLREALAGLLNDTQHSEHNCGDPQCPVDAARAALNP